MLPRRSIAALPACSGRSRTRCTSAHGFLSAGGLGCTSGWPARGRSSGPVSSTHSQERGDTSGHDTVDAARGGPYSSEGISWADRDMRSVPGGRGSMRRRPVRPGPLAQQARALPLQGRGHPFEPDTAHLPAGGAILNRTADLLCRKTSDRLTPPAPAGALMALPAAGDSAARVQV